MKKENSRVMGLLLGALLVGCGGVPTDEDNADATLDANLVEETGEAIVNIPGLGPQRVHYVVRNGVAYHSEDIEISPEELSGLADPRTTAAGIASEYARWPGGVVPFEIDQSAVPLAVPISQAIAAWTSAMADGAGNPTISFVNSNGLGQRVRFVVDNSIPGVGSSPLGRQPQDTTIRLKSTANTRTVTHELGHALGLYHEHQRPNRDNAMIVWDGTNGRENRLVASLAHNYKKFDEAGTTFGQVDFTSIMMYPSSSSGCSKNPCLTTLNGTGTWNQSNTISAGDVNGIRRLYLMLATSSTTFQDTQTPLKNVVLVVPQNTAAQSRTLAMRPADKHLMYYAGNGLDNSVEDFGLVTNSGTPGRFSAVAGNVGRFDWVSVTSANTITRGIRSGATTTYENIASGGSTVGTSIVRQPNATQLDLFSVFGSPPRIHMKSYIGGKWTGQCPASPASDCVEGWHVTKPTSGRIVGGQIAAVSAPDPNKKRLDVVAVTTLGIEHMYWTAVSGWQGPVTISSVASSAVAITSTGSRVDVFHQTASGATFRTSYANTWGASVRLGLGTDPAEIGAAAWWTGSEIVLQATTHVTPPGFWSLDSYRQ